MSDPISKINEKMQGLGKVVARSEMKQFWRIVRQINVRSLEHHTEDELKTMASRLARVGKAGENLQDLRIDAYALAREASRRVLGLYPFDVQLLAAVAMDQGKLIEMQTGEGKTLAAVLPAYLNALSGKGVHVLTFNDYLARRDAEWMGPLYRFLGMTVGFVQEGMGVDERKKAYAADVTYVTAKEAGFDYLRGVLCEKKEDLVHRPFHFAIVDEADSILIDEARVPLVIAGNVSETAEMSLRIPDLIRELVPQEHYATDENARNVFFTEAGVEYLESVLGCGNLFRGENAKLLPRLNQALHAEVLLKRDVDYIVRNGKVELVDEFTGRVAENRHWPDGLQEAVEEKEGIRAGSRGQVLDSITLQSFLSLYPKIAGMTGTAKTAAMDFEEFYNTQVTTIPTHKPCIRKDQPDKIFTHKAAKQKAVIQEVAAAHALGRPVLIGTSTVEESEQLAAALLEAGVRCEVLNAKNDMLEAAIIAKAGCLGAVTVSTNMAGRGTDIRLGGEEEKDRDQIVALGGLYVIGTNKHESRRVDNQLRGRAGRQGDPGETRFFVSLEDDLMVRFRLKELIPAQFYPARQDDPIEHPVVRREVARAQRIVEGQNFEIRRMLWKYTHNLEMQRRRIHTLHRNILEDRAELCLLSKAAAERYQELLTEVGAEVLKKAERQITLYHINRCWAEYLDFVSYTRASIHLVNIGGKSPILEFNQTIIAAFEEMQKEIHEEIVKTFLSANITRDGLDPESAGIKGPSSTWTYLITDSAKQFRKVKTEQATAEALFNPLMMILLGLYERFFKSERRVK